MIKAPIRYIGAKSLHSGKKKINKNTHQTDMQKDNFCPGTGIWIRKCPDNLFGQISSMKGYKSKYYGVSCKNVVKLAFI